MKTLAYLTLLLLISNIFSSSSECQNKDGSKGNDCKGLAVSSGFDYCCYYSTKYKKEGSGEEKEDTGCTELTKAQYDDIEKFIKDIEEENKKEEMKVKIDCKNDYIKYSLLSLIILILL